MKAAYSRDPSFAALRRPTDRTSLGLAAHGLTELCWSGEFDPAGPTAEEWLSATWQQVIDTMHERLVAAWAPATPPPPAKWPGYALTRARLLVRLLPVAQARGTSPTDKATWTPQKRGTTVPLPWVERRLTDHERGIEGTPDLVELRPGGIAVVDLKSGVAQGPMSDAQRRQLLLYAHLVSVSGQPMPTHAAVLDAAGREQTFTVEPDEVGEAVATLIAARSSYNEAVERATVEDLANAGPDACRGCPYRAACRPFRRYWSEDWNVGRGVWGELRAQTCHRGTYEVEVLAKGPLELVGQVVRVLGLPAPVDAAVGTDVAIVRTALLGSPLAQRARWSTLLWPLPRDPAHEAAQN